MTKDIIIFTTTFLSTITAIAVIYMAKVIVSNNRTVESDFRYLDSRIDKIENDVHGINLRLAPPQSLDTPGFSTPNEVGVEVPNEVAGLQ